MLPAKNRLSKKKDIEDIFKKGKTIKEDFLIFKYIKKKSTQIKFGFIVSKKVAKKATTRNRLKRMISELAGQKIKRAKGGVQALFISLPGIEKKDFWELEAIIEKIFKKADIYDNW